MLGALLLGFARWMQGIGKQQQARDQVWVFGAEHAGLAAAIGMAGEKNSSPSLPQRTRQGWGTQSLFHCGNGILQSGAVAGGVARAGRAPGARLAIGEIAAQDGESGGGESLGQGDEQRSLGVRAGAVGQDHAVAVGCFRQMQEAADVGLDPVVNKFANGSGRQENILTPANRHADSYAMLQKHTMHRTMLRKTWPCYRSGQERIQGEHQMRVRRQVVTVAVFALTAAFVIASPAGSSFPYGTMQSSCAPWDGPAVEIRLTTEPSQCKRVSEPYVSIAVWRGLPIHAGQVLKFGAGSDAGSAARCAKEGDCKLAQSATIVFDKYQERSGAAGQYELQFKGGEILKGTFEVKWCEERVICG